MHKTSAKNIIYTSSCIDNAYRFDREGDFY